MLCQYACLGIAIITTGDFLVATLSATFDWLMSDKGLNIAGRAYLDLALAVGLAAVTFFTHQYKEKIRDMVSNWAPMEFDPPVVVKTGVRDDAGNILTCKFTAELTLWFSSDDDVEQMKRYENKVRNALKLFLEEASQDPLLRRSKTYLNDWFNESFHLPELRKVEVHSIKMSPVTNMED